MPWINPTHNTRLKLRPIDSSQLGANEWRDRAKGDKLGVINARPADAQHWEIKMAGPLTIGGKQHQTCFIYAPHWTGVAEIAAKAQSIARSTALNTAVSAPTAINGGYRLDVRYRSQMDNANNPSGSCNVTSAAMCLDYWGVAAKGAGQLEDELYVEMQRRDWSRHDPRDLKRIIEVYGCKDYYSSNASLDDLRQAIKNGYPCIIHGYFTTFGHIVAAVGYDDTGVIVHDPYGEWHSWGYARNDSVKPDRGKYLHYSYGLIESTCLPDGNLWLHIVSRPGQTPQTVATAPQSTPKQSNLSTVTATVNTALKTDWRYQSKDLPPNQVSAIAAGTEIECVITKAPNQNGHILITLPDDKLIAGQNTWYVFEQHVKVINPNRTITAADIDRAAAEIGIEPRVMWAVMEVEAAGSGFFPSGRCKILFEAHWFSDFTQGKYDRSHPQISSARWNRDLYYGGEREWDRLEAAAALDRDAAYQSASWGLGQIMGFHWRDLGYKSVADFADSMGRSEGEQLLAMARFIKRDRRLVRALQAKDWAGFAEIYNGPGFALNQYDKKLADVYASASTA
jgi:uncharacterized protein YvpB